jgi:hypothetical protein
MVWAMRDLPMPGSPEDIGLAVTPGGRYDDFELRHERDLSPKRWR